MYVAVYLYFFVGGFSSCYFIVVILIYAIIFPVANLT